MTWMAWRGRPEAGGACQDFFKLMKMNIEDRKGLEEATAGRLPDVASRGFCELAKSVRIAVLGGICRIRFLSKEGFLFRGTRSR